MGYFSLWAFAATGSFTVRVHSSLEQLITKFFLILKQTSVIYKAPLFALWSNTGKVQFLSPFIAQQRFQGSYCIIPSFSLSSYTFCSSEEVFPYSMYNHTLHNPGHLTGHNQFINISFKMWFPELNPALHPDVDWPVRHAGLPRLLLPQAECISFVNSYDILPIQNWTHFPQENILYKNCCETRTFQHPSH